MDDKAETSSNDHIKEVVNKEANDNLVRAI